MTKENRSPWRRRLRRLLFVLLTLLILFWPATYLMARVLKRYEDAPNATHLLLLDAHDAYEPAAERWNANPKLGILSVQKIPDRVMQLGVLPRFEDHMRTNLIRLGVPSEQYEVIPGPVDRPRELAERLDQWLSDHPRAVVIGLTDTFAGSAWRSLFDDALGSENRGRVKIQSIERDEYDATNWWRKRHGQIDIISKYMGMLTK